MTSTHSAQADAPQPLINPAPDAPDRMPFWLRLCRDLILACVVAMLWLWGDTWLTTQPDHWAEPIQFIAGLIASLFVAGFFHEWGHLTGARLSGARAPINGWKESMAFCFNLEQNSARQFRWMSLGGTIGPALLFCYLFLNWSFEAKGEQGFLFGAIVLALGSSLIEAPIIWRSLKGLSNQHAWDKHAAYRARNMVIGYSCALLIAVVTLHGI